MQARILKGFLKDFKVNGSNRDAFLDGVTRSSRKPAQDLVMRKKWVKNEPTVIDSHSRSSCQGGFKSGQCCNFCFSPGAVWGVQGMGRRQDKERGTAEEVPSHHLP